MTRREPELTDIPTRSLRFVGREVERIEDAHTLFPTLSTEVPVSPNRLWGLIQTAIQGRSDK